jgi:hypothetical protein
MRFDFVVAEDKCTRFVDGGRLATDGPGRHSIAVRIGRGTKPPPQFGVDPGMVQRIRRRLRWLKATLTQTKRHEG